MSQLFPVPQEPLPLMPIEDDSQGQMPLDEHMANLDLIEQAMQSVSGQPLLLDTLPDYYDDMLMKLIDAVPLE